jgi:hypothetical protein
MNITLYLNTNFKGKKMKKILVTALSTLAAAALVGCGSGGSDTITVEPAPVEVQVVVVNGEEENTPTQLFDGIRAAYNVTDYGVKLEVRMLDNKNIDLFNFIVIVELEDGDIFYSEPNAERENGSIAVRDEIVIKEGGRYTVSLFYYGEDDTQLTKHVIDF